MTYRPLLLFFLIVSSAFALEFKVASYNVENLFDLKYDKTEYKEYVPNSKYWNENSFQKKLLNTSKTIKQIDADIISLQEIESKTALLKLLKKLNYKYYKFSKKKTASVGVAILSKYPIIKSEQIDINRYDKHSRYILKTTISINQKELIIYTNHWRSKRASESKRIRYATALRNDIDKLNKKTDYIILGDLNSNYNEYETFKYDKKLNDTYGITGINQVLNTSYNGNLVLKGDLFNSDKILHYNLWLELNKSQRFSAKFKSSLNTPDNIIISKSLVDNENISYVNNSFNIFKPKYLYKNGYIQRWNMKKAKGHSDHLPIYAIFSTKKQNYSLNYKETENAEFTIEDLYKIQTINEPINLKKCIVIYKAKKFAIIKQINNRSIYIYKPQKDIKEGFIYNLTVNSIDRYNGLKEIKNISNVKEIGKYINYKKLYLDGEKINLYNRINQNEIITKLNGKYKKGYLLFRDSKIKLYFKKGIKKPEEGKYITISSGHLGIYKSKVQIIVNKQSDFY